MSDYTRKCPKCQHDICYTTVFNMRNAERDSRLCKKCAASIKDYSYRKEKEYRKRLTESINESFKNGRKLSFLGKKHSEETKSVIRQKQLDIIEKYKTTEHRQKMSKALSGERNPMYGKNIFSIWCEKYGIEEANKRENERRKKLSVASEGKNNAMYGKPTPVNAGVGWRGKFENLTFRSLRELMFIIEMKENNKSIESAEHLKICYKDYNGTDRTYRPDFIILQEKKIVEIKPLKLINSPLVKIKYKALQSWCEQNGYICEIRDMIIDLEKIKQYYYKSNIVFEKRYLELFKKYLN